MVRPARRRGRRARRHDLAGRDLWRRLARLDRQVRPAGLDRARREDRLHGRLARRQPGAADRRQAAGPDPVRHDRSLGAVVSRGRAGRLLRRDRLWPARQRALRAGVGARRAADDGALHRRRHRLQHREVQGRRGRAAGALRRSRQPEAARPRGVRRSRPSAALERGGRAGARERRRRRQHERRDRRRQRDRAVLFLHLVDRARLAHEQRRHLGIGVARRLGRAHQALGRAALGRLSEDRRFFRRAVAVDPLDRRRRQERGGRTRLSRCLVGGRGPLQIQRGHRQHSGQSAGARPHGGGCQQPRAAAAHRRRSGSHPSSRRASTSGR